jgi:ABC-type transport system substrate-binding protein/methyl-accepting chemotaxis protein
MKLFNFNSKTSSTVRDIPEPAEARWRPSDDLLDVLKKIDQFLKILPELSMNISALSSVERGHLANIHAFGESLAEAFEGMDAIANSSSLVTGNSQEYKQVIARAEQQLKGALDSFELVDQSYQRSAVELKDLFTTTAELEKLAGLMAGLSVRIKQLVRNAEIRAFHAGGKGKGFGVIAENMSRLAGEMEKTASLVPSLTAGVKDKIQQMSSGVLESRHLVDGLKSGAEKVKDKLNSLYHSNQGMVEAFDRIGLMAREQRELENKLVGGLKNISQSAEGLSVSQEVAALVLSTETGEMGQVEFAKNQMDEALGLWETAGHQAALHEARNNWMMLKAKLQAASERWRDLQSTIDEQKTALGSEEELAGTLWHNLESLFENINRIKSGLDGMAKTIGSNRQDFEEMNQGLTGSFDDLARVKTWLDEFEADREGLSGKLGEISQTGAAIKDFTEQIKLLSFYAAVEVAEMGREGGAFGGIVAQAQALSQQAAADSARIGPLLKQVTEQFSQTSDTIRQTQKIMATSLESVSLARRSLGLARESGGRMEQIVAEAGSGIDRQQARRQDILNRYTTYSQSYREVAAKLQGFSGFLQKGRESLAWFERMGSLGRAEIDLAGRENFTGGQLQLDISSDPITLDPVMMTDATTNEVATQIFEGLVQFGAGASVIPAVAWRWKISTDGLSWTFYLRRGIKFSHGREVTAPDVKYSLERLLSPRIKSPNQSFVEMIKGALEYSQGKAKEVDGLQVIDPYAIKIVLQYPFMPFLSNLACTMAAIVPNELVEEGSLDFSRHPVGSGPFILKSWEPGKTLELEPNPHYHERRISLSGIKYSIDLNDEQKTEALVSGRLDITDVNSLQRRALSQDHTLKVISLPQLNVQYLCINVSRVSPFADKRVRQALNHAIDKKTLIETTGLAGDALTANGVFPPELWAHNPNLAGYGYDPGLAKKLLAEAGFAGGLPGEYLLDIRDGKAQMQRAEMVRQNCREVGINIKPNPLSWKTLLEKTYGCQSQLSFNGWSSDNGDPDNFLYPLFHSKNTGRAGNVAFFKSPVIDSLLEEAVTIRDPGQRLLRYRKIEELIVQEAPWVFLYHSVKSTAVRNTVHGFRPRPFGSELYKHCWVEQ